MKIAWRVDNGQAIFYGGQVLARINVNYALLLQEQVLRQGLE